MEEGCSLVYRLGPESRAAPVGASVAHEIPSMRIVLISTYELGRQPFGLASPAAWLRRAGFDVSAVDLSRQILDAELIRSAEKIALYLPMHTATRIAVVAIPKIRHIHPQARLCAYGLYAPVNRELLRELGVETIIGGEFEDGLLAWAQGSHEVPGISLSRLQFVTPDRRGLPTLDRYAHLTLPDGSTRVVGYTEATRGCKHRCRHCPIVPVYNGAFRIVQRDVVLADIRQQVAAGAQHITFGDPDFFNGPAHGLEVVRELHREFPKLSYDVTIKIEHLLKHADAVAELRDTGCSFVTSAVESVDDRVLELLDKGHTRLDFVRVAELFRDLSMFLVPTFVPFTPWTSLGGYEDLLLTIVELGLIEQVPPIQLAIRLLIPSGSRLLELEEMRGIVGEFDRQALSYRWKNPDPRVDELQKKIEVAVQDASKRKISRTATFEVLWNLLQRAKQEERPLPIPSVPPSQNRATIPYLTEPWYC